MSDPLFAASATGMEIDHLIWALLAVSAGMLALVFGLMLLFVIRYRASSPVDRGHPAEEKSWRIEIGWTAATLAAFFGLFLWGDLLYERLYLPPADAFKVFVVGKQWMWKLEYPGGQREINSLHVPAGRPVELILTSEDVIHDFSVPALRVKQDVVPGRYESVWFEATRPGTYHLFCTQFCGTDHAAMGGTVTVLSEADFTQWLGRQDSDGTLAAAGRELFLSRGCDGCHGGRGTVRAPALEGLFGGPVTLADGGTAVADEAYLRDAILRPDRLRVAGYPAVMPSFAGRLDEDELLKLVAYIESLGAP